MRISDWSSNLCSSDLNGADDPAARKMAPRDRAGDSGDIVGEVEERVVRDPQDHGHFGRERAPEELPHLLGGRHTLRRSEERREGTKCGRQGSSQWWGSE